MAIGMKNAEPRKGAAPVRRSAPTGTKPGTDKSSARPPMKQSAPTNKDNRTAVESDDLDDYKVEPAKSNLNIPVIAGIAAVVIIGGIAAITLGGKSSAGENTEVVVDNAGDTQDVNAGPSYLYDDEGNAIYDQFGNIVNPDAINPGFSDSSNTYYSTAGSAPKEVYDATDYIKDLNGVNVSAVYDVENTVHAIDYANYVKKRAIIDEGMEMYWVDLVYEGKKYRAQVSFNTFRYLKDSGICKIDMEIQNLVGGGKIVTYITILNDDNTPT